MISQDLQLVKHFSCFSEVFRFIITALRTACIYYHFHQDLSSTFSKKWSFMAAPHNSARGSSERFCPKIKFGKRRNTLCTRRGCAASVSQLTLATAALYFKFFKLQYWGERSAAVRRRNYAVLPYFHLQYVPPCPAFAVPSRGMFIILKDSTNPGPVPARAVPMRHWASSSLLWDSDPSAVPLRRQAYSCA